MSETIQVQQLAPADILLYQGKSLLSKAIQLIDGTEVSHVSLNLGDGEVGEALGGGLVQQNLKTSVDGANWIRVHRLKESVDMTPVLSKARSYIDNGNRYAYEQLLLLAFICLIRKPKVTPVLRPLIKGVLDASSALLNRLAEEGREPMICSEFVYRAYDEAILETGDRYSLSINYFSPVERVIDEFSNSTFTIPQKNIKDNFIGQGIHPQSLLFLMSSSSSRVWFINKVFNEGLVDINKTNEPKPEIEPLIAQYLEEVKTNTNGYVESTIEIEEIFRSVERFALSLAYARSDHSKVDAFRDNVLSIRSSVAINHLLRVSADFVTPGDLYKTQSLFSLGQLEN